MTLTYALPKTGHPNCRRPDKVIDAGHEMCKMSTAPILTKVKSGLDPLFLVMSSKKTVLSEKQ